MGVDKQRVMEGKRFSPFSVLRVSSLKSTLVSIKRPTGLLLFDLLCISWFRIQVERENRKRRELDWQKNESH